MRRITLTITGNAVQRIFFNGFLVGVYLDYAGGHTSATDVTLFRQVGANEDTLLSVTNSNTNANYPLRVQGKDSSGTAISGIYGYPAIDGELAMRVLGGAAGGTVTAHLTVLDDDARAGRF